MVYQFVIFLNYLESISGRQETYEYVGDDVPWKPFGVSKGLDRLLWQTGN